MDTKDQQTEFASSDPLLSDSSLTPLEQEAPDLSNGDGMLLTGDTGEQKPKKSPTPLQDSLRRLGRDKRAMISLGALVFLFLLPLLGPVIYQHIGGPYHSFLNGTLGPAAYHSPFHQELDRQDEGPSAQYWLGTDAIGRDLLARLMQGLLISLAVAVVVEIVDILLGVLIGVLAGY